MQLIQITENQCLGWILQHPELVEKAFSMDNPRFEKTLSYYAAVVDENEILGVFKYERFSEFAIQVHGYLNPKYWHTGLSQECMNKMCEFFKEAGEKSLVVICPASCQHVRKFCKAAGYKQRGRLKNTMLWKGKVVDSVIMQRDL